jgi:hypothetical protein
MMHRLKEIIRVIGRRRLKKIEVFNDSSSTNRKNTYNKFYHGVKDGLYKTDDEAALALCNTDASDKKYLMLKSRVRNRLLNTLFFLDNSTRAEYQQAILQCNRNFMAAKVLLLNGARGAGESLLRTTLTQAEKFEITDVALNCILLLRYAAAFAGRVAEFELLRKRFNEVSAIFNDECLAEEYYQILVLPFGKSDSNRPDLAHLAKTYVAEIEVMLKRHDSFNLELGIFRLKVVAGQLGMDFDLVLKACEEFEIRLQYKKHMSASIRYGEIGIYRMVAYLNLGRYEEGKAAAAVSIHHFGEGSPNWVVYLENYFLLCMHTGNYLQASEIHTKVTSHPYFESIDPTRQEKWRIFEAFLRYMLSGSIDAASGEVAENQFKLMKFLNDVPNYSKDKRGLNIAILILQVLFLLDRRDFDGIIARAEALKVYCSRYLKEDENYRSNCFLKMMLMMEKKSFNYEGTHKITERYFNMLQASRFSYQNGSLTSLEIIPYEQLWNTILGKLRAMA